MKTTHKTHCPKGHAYDEDNTYFDRRGYRRCRKCKPRRQEMRKCRHGHPRTPENTYVRIVGDRTISRCRTCHLENKKRADEAKRQWKGPNLPTAPLMEVLKIRALGEGYLSPTAYLLSLGFTPKMLERPSIRHTTADKVATAMRVHPSEVWGNDFYEGVND